MRRSRARRGSPQAPTHSSGRDAAVSSSSTSMLARRQERQHAAAARNCVWEGGKRRRRELAGAVRSPQRRAGGAQSLSARGRGRPLRTGRHPPRPGAAASEGSRPPSIATHHFGVLLVLQQELKHFIQRVLGHIDPLGAGAGCQGAFPPSTTRRGRAGPVAQRGVGIRLCKLLSAPQSASARFPLRSAACTRHICCPQSA